MTDELSARAIHERHMRESLEYRREYERTRFANDVAVRVVQYRAEHGLSQTALAKLLDMHQPAIARLEAGDHEPSLTTLSRLAQVLGEDFSVDIKPDRMELRSVGLSRAKLVDIHTAAQGRAPEPGRSGRSEELPDSGIRSLLLRRCAAAAGRRGRCAGRTPRSCGCRPTAATGCGHGRR